MSQKRRIVLLCLLFFVVLLMVWGKVIYLFNFGKKTNSWPSVQGKILDSKTVQQTVQGKVEFKAYLRYEYMVQGETFYGSRITIDDGWSKDQKIVNQYLKQYPFHSTPKIYYDPQNTSYCLLQTGYRMKNPLLMGWLTFIITVLVILGALDVKGMNKLGEKQYLELEEKKFQRKWGPRFLAYENFTKKNIFGVLFSKEFFLFTLFLWVGILILLQEFFFPNWTPPKRAILAILLALPCSLIISCFRQFQQRSDDSFS